jgi:isoleucyl-tRNA synthetase
VSATASSVKILRDRGARALSDMLMVSEVELIEGEPVSPAPASIEVLVADGVKCPRCWNLRSDIGGDPAYPDLCSRCVAVVMG